MLSRDDELRQRLIATFKVEAHERVNAIASGLVRLESAGADEQGEIVESVYREAHSLKGAARAVGLTKVESICQSLESVFAAMKRGESAPSPELFDLLHRHVDEVTRLLDTHESTVKPVAPSSRAGQAPAAERPTMPAPLESEGSYGTAATQETIRISASRLQDLLLGAEELLSAKLSAGALAAELRETRDSFAEWRKQWARCQPDARANSVGSFGPTTNSGGAGVRRLLEFVEWNREFVQSLATRFGQSTHTAEQQSRALTGMVDNLLEGMKQAMMLPFAAILEVFPKLVRDLARERGKEAELVVHGAELEIDRRVLEEVKDPIIHLVRNSIDHGLETPAERERKGKPARGTITIAVSQKDSSKVEVVVADDGAGVDVARVRTVAQKLGIISDEDGGDEEGALRIIFHSGLSTSPIITDLSGRGLGLAIVREKVGRLGGSVTVETQTDAGATFRLLLPLTLATFRGVLVRAGGRIFALPTIHVERALRVRKDEVKTVENRETIAIDERVTPLVPLAAVMQSSDATRADKSPWLHAVVARVGDERVAFSVDEVLDQRDVLIKGLGPQLTRVRNIAAATVTADGKVIPILNVGDLLKAAAAPSVTPMAAREPAEEAPRQSILVVEDSITARTLLKNILAAADYEVETAVDGIDAFTKLRTNTFDLVVSDVEMPRMNGFDLTAKIRSDPKLADLPVVLVTALAAREDRERGVEAGANAYIVKSDFDQSNLLEAIRRLI